MSYKIDLDNMCRSIESDMSLETFEYVEDNTRSVEWKMKESEFNSKRKDIENGLGKLYDAIKSKMDDVIKTASERAIKKVQKKNPMAKEKEIEAIVKSAFVINDKSKFIKETMDAITSNGKSEGHYGGVFLSLDSSKLSQTFGSRWKEVGKSLLGGQLVSGVIGGIAVGVTMAIGGIPAVIVAAPFLQALGNASFGAGAMGTLMNTSYGKAEVGSAKNANQSVKDLNLKKMFKVEWDNNQFRKGALKKGWNYQNSKGESKLLIVPKFKIKLGK